MTTLLVVNPAAGRGRARFLAGEAERAARAAWGVVHTVRTTAPLSGVAQVQEAVEAGVERVLVLGGDGTIHEAVNGLLRARVTDPPPIGILPAGTGNDFAKMTGTARLAPSEAIRRLTRASIRRHDVGWAWDEYFINSVGIGFDAEVARVVSGWKWAGGLPAYLLAVLQVLARFRPLSLTVRGDGGDFSDRLMLLEVAIGPCVGGGFRLAPRARPDDGWMDLCAIRQLSMPALLLRLPLTIFGWHTGLAAVRMQRVRTAEITQTDADRGPQALPAQFDGELRRVSGRMEVRIVPAALPVLVAPAA